LQVALSLVSFPEIMVVLAASDYEEMHFRDVLTCVCLFLLCLLLLTACVWGPEGRLPAALAPSLQHQ
jgi:hypothetical protein